MIDVLVEFDEAPTRPEIQILQRKQCEIAGIKADLVSN
jgi:predicted nucleotidyltransferase